MELEVVCPPDCGPGDVITVQTEDGELEIEIPEGVGPGEAFEVRIEGDDDEDGDSDLDGLLSSSEEGEEFSSDEEMDPALAAMLAGSEPAPQPVARVDQPAASVRQPDPVVTESAPPSDETVEVRGVDDGAPGSSNGPGHNATVSSVSSDDSAEELSEDEEDGLDPAMAALLAGTNAAPQPTADIEPVPLQQADDAKAVHAAEQAERNLMRMWASDEESGVEVSHPPAATAAAEPVHVPAPAPAPTPAAALAPAPSSAPARAPALEPEPEPEPESESEPEPEQEQEQEPKSGRQPEPELRASPAQQQQKAVPMPSPQRSKPAVVVAPIVGGGKRKLTPREEAERRRQAAIEPREFRKLGPVNSQQRSAAERLAVARRPSPRPEAPPSPSQFSGGGSSAGFSKALAERLSSPKSIPKEDDGSFAVEPETAGSRFFSRDTALRLHSQPLACQRTRDQNESVPRRKKAVVPPAHLAVTVERLAEPKYRPHEDASPRFSLPEESHLRPKRTGRRRRDADAPAIFERLHAESREGFVTVRKRDFQEQANEGLSGWSAQRRNGHNQRQGRPDRTGSTFSSESQEYEEESFSEYRDEQEEERLQEIEEQLRVADWLMQDMSQKLANPADGDEIGNDVEEGVPEEMPSASVVSAHVSTWRKPSLAECAQLFNAMAIKDGGNALSLSDFDSGIAQLVPELHHTPSLHRAFAVADANKDGKINRSEFQRLLQYTGFFVSMSEVFDGAGVDWDGTIDLDEFRRICSQLIGDNADTKLSDEELQLVFTEIDAGGVGTVQFSKLCQWSARYFTMETLRQYQQAPAGHSSELQLVPSSAAVRYTARRVGRRAARANHGQVANLSPKVHRQLHDRLDFEGAGPRPATVIHSADADAERRAVAAMNAAELKAEVESLSTSSRLGPPTGSNLSLEGSRDDAGAAGWDTDSTVSGVSDATSKMALYAEAAVTKLQVEQARAKQLEQELAQVRQSQQSRASRSDNAEEIRRSQQSIASRGGNADSKGPTHLPGFMWPTHQHDTKLGGATYSKLGVKKRGPRASSDAGSDISSSITTTDINGWSNQLRGSSGPGHSSRSASRKYKSAAIHIENVNGMHLSDEAMYPNRAGPDHRRSGPHQSSGDVQSLSGSHLERLAEDSSVKGGFQMMVNIPVHELSAMRKRMESLEATVAHVMEDPSVVRDWDGTFDSAVRELAQAVKQVDIAGDQANSSRTQEVYHAENKLESWSKLVCRHPEYLAKEAEFARWWDEEHAEKHEHSLAIMRKIFPRQAILPEIQPRADLRRRWRIKRECTKRLWQHKILSFIWMEPDEIDALHFTELDTKYWSYGLDIVEMRAVYAQLPDKFSSELDLDGKKAQWLANFRDVLVDLSAEEQAGTLSDARTRHVCYRADGEELSEHERILLTFFEKHEPTYANIQKVRQLSNFFKARVERDDKAALTSTSPSGGAARRGGSAVAQYRSLFEAVSHQGKTKQEVAAERRRVLAQERAWRTVMYDEFTKYYRADPRRVWQFSKAAHLQKRQIAVDCGADGVVRQHGLLQPESRSKDVVDSTSSELLIEIAPTMEGASATSTRCKFATATFGAVRMEFSRCAAVCARPLLADAPLENAAVVSGKLAVVLRGGVSFVQKARNVQAAGAVGVICVNTDEELFQVGGEEGDDDVSLAVIGLRASDGAALLRTAAAWGADTLARSAPAFATFKFDRSTDDHEPNFSSEEDEYDDGFESDGSDWGPDRLAALIPAGTWDQLLGEMRAAVTALGIDPQRPAGSDDWDRRVEEMQREQMLVAEQQRARLELQSRVRSGEGVEKFAGGRRGPSQPQTNSPQRKGLGDVIREEEMQEMARSTKVTLAGGVEKAKAKFEAIHRTTSALQKLEDYEIQRRKLESKESGSSPPPRFSPAEMLPEGLPPPRASSASTAAPSWAPGPARVASRAYDNPDSDATTPSRRRQSSAVNRARAQAASARATPTAPAKVASPAAGAVPAHVPAPTVAATPPPMSKDLEAAAEATRAKVRLFTRLCFLCACARARACVVCVRAWCVCGLLSCRANVCKLQVRAKAKSSAARAKAAKARQRMLELATQRQDQPVED